MPSPLETVIYVVVAVIVLSVVASIYVLATTEASKAEDTEPYGDASLLGRDEL